jgi:NAD+ synthase (glutamine-hydrolysing)
VKIGIANVNTTVGPFHSNVERAVELVEVMAADGVTLGGSPVRSLLLD